MSTRARRPAPSDAAVGDPLSMQDLGAVLVRHYGLHEGHYSLLVEFQIGTGAVGKEPASALPGASVAIARIGLARTDQKSGPLVIDAAQVNPRPKARPRSPKG